jgi:DNA-binding protein YbaB
LEFTKNRYLNPVKNEPLPVPLAQFLRDRHDAKSGFIQCVANSEEEAEQGLEMLKSMHMTHEFGGKAITKISSNGRQYVAQILMNPVEVEEDEVVMDRIMSAYK